jgi:hypothetical protein
MKLPEQGYGVARSGREPSEVLSELHAALAAGAEDQGVSLNTLIVTLLAGGIGWGRVEAARVDAPGKQVVASSAPGDRR